jgi:hypothetical protein
MTFRWRVLYKNQMCVNLVMNVFRHKILRGVYFENLDTSYIKDKKKHITWIIHFR